MPDIIRWRDRSNLARPIAGQATGVTAIEDGEKLRAVWKSAVVTQKVVVGNGAFLCPMKIVRHQAFIDMIDFLGGVVIGQLRAVAAVKQDALVAVRGAVQQPIDAFANRCAGGALVQDDANILRIEPDFLQNAAHEKHVVDAAFQTRLPGPDNC